MADNITKKEHGGARLGAGRPRAKEQSRLYTFRASGEMARFIDDHEPKTEFIKKCIAQEMAGAEQETSDLEQGDAGLGQEPSGLEQERSVFEQTSLSKLGAVYPATMVKNMNINVFDIGKYTLKRFEMRDGTGWLIPANPDYPEIKVTADDSFSIWGTVSYIIHKPH